MAQTRLSQWAKSCHQAFQHGPVASTTRPGAEVGENLRLLGTGYRLEFNIGIPSRHLRYLFAVRLNWVDTRYPELGRYGGTGST